MHFKTRRPVALLLAIAAGPILAQTSAPTSPPAEDFETAKAQHLVHLRQELTCVEAATTLQELHACRPKPPMGAPGPPRE
jgi:hypothetical protein